MKEDRIVQIAKSHEEEEGFEQVSIKRREEDAFEVKPVQQSPSKIKQSK